MAITQKYSTNAALQYNEVLTNYLINDASANKKFLTNAPLNRLIRENELSALYFLIDDSSFSGTTILKFKDDSGALIYEEYSTLTSTYNIHNGLLVGFEGVPYFVPANTKKICAVISSNANVFNNPNFIGGTGDLFTSWTLAQPSRTNILTYSDDLTNAAWTKSDVTAAAGSITGNVGNAFKFVFYQLAAPLAGDYTLQLKAKYSTHQFIQVLWSGEGHYTNIDLINGTTASFAGETSTIRLLEDGYYLISISFTAVATDGHFIALVDSLASTRASNTSSTNIVLIKNQMIQTVLFITPYIPTTNAAVTTSLGEFLQDAAGGVDGSRAMKLWADVGGITFASQTRTLATTNYVFKAWAKIIDTGVTNPKIGLVINGVDVGRSAVLTTAYQWIEIPFSATAGTYAEAIFYENDENYGFAIIDNVSIRKAVDTEITEERCFELDTRCFQTENTIQWVNKLGGVDTWTFTGNPIETRNTEREGLIEYPMQDNYESPNEIYAYRSIKSHEVMNLFHRCENEETAIWLRSELQDTIQAYVKVGDDYHPIIPTTSSVQIRNYAQRDPNVRFTFRFAYDINIQRR